MTEAGTIPTEIVQQVIESSDYVAALEDVLTKAQTYLRFFNRYPMHQKAEKEFREAVQTAELLR